MRLIPTLVLALASCATTVQQDDRTEAEACLARTEELVTRAETAVRDRGNARQHYRGAFMRQDAARRALEQGKPAMAAKLSLQSRRHAVKVLQANGVAAERVELPGEKALANKADDGEHDRFMEEAEKRTPVADQILGLSGGLDSDVRDLLKRSEAALNQAREVALAGGKEKNKYRGAWIREEAARQALADGKPRMAAKFSLLSRKLAVKVIEGNGRKLDPALAERADEKAIKAPVEDAPDDEYDARLAAIERSAPDADELLRRTR